jgi:ParB family chromosome partitioning protein
MKANPALGEMETALKAAQKGMPKNEDKLWDWLLDQDQKRLLEVLALCVASTVDAVEKKRGSFDGDPSPENADQLAVALKLDMTDYWQPTATNYFDRVSSAQIIAAVTDACGKAEAGKLAGLKKGDLAKAAERLLKGKSWLPAILRKGKGA